MDQQTGHFLPVIDLHLPWGLPPKRQTAELTGLVCGCLLPLLRMLHKLEDAKCSYGIALSFSPELIYQLEDEQLCNNILEELRDRVEDSLTGNTTSASQHHRLNQARDDLFWFEQRCKKRVFGAFCAIAALGQVELFTSPAAYAPLPLLQATPKAIERQLQRATAYFRAASGAASSGLLLPGCAYVNGLDQQISKQHIRWTITAEKSFARSDTPLLKGTRQPVLTRTSTVIFCVNPELQHKMLDPQNGYCTHASVHKHEMSGRAEWKNLSGASYDRELAERTADHQATEFLNFLSDHTSEQLTDLILLDGLFISAHWNEGIHFLHMLLLKIHFDQNRVKAITPSRYINLGYPLQQANPGNGALTEDGELTGLYKGGVDAALTDVNLAEERIASLLGANTTAQTKPLIEQMEQELLLAQGLLKYPLQDFNAIERSKKHLTRLSALDKLVTSGGSDTQLLEEMKSGAPQLLP